MTTPEDRKALWRQMLRIRLVEERIAELYKNQEMRCPVHLCIGQEAPAVGVCSRLRREDYVLSTHRSHAHYLAKGGDLKAMLAELYGRADGCCRGKGGSMHLLDLAVGFLGATPIVGSTIAIAVGAAFGSVLRGDKRVTVAFFGDAACEEGVFYESLNFALLKSLPVVFVCENNLYSVYSGLSVRQPGGRKIFQLARGCGVESAQSDGNDVLAVAELAARAVAKARSGGGPSFLEFKTYRWREHCGPAYDNDLGYRTQREFQDWRRRCPVAALREHLRADGALDDAEAARAEREMLSEIDAAVRSARKSPPPAPDQLLKGIYAGATATRKRIGGRKRCRAN